MIFFSSLHYFFFLFVRKSSKCCPMIYKSFSDTWGTDDSNPKLGIRLCEHVSEWCWSGCVCHQDYQIWCTVKSSHTLQYVHKASCWWVEQHPISFLQHFQSTDQCPLESICNQIIITNQSLYRIHGERYKEENNKE